MANQPVSGFQLSAFAGSVVVLASGVVFSFGGLAFRLTDDIDAWQYIIFRGLGALIATVVILGWRYRSRFQVLKASIEPDHVLAGLLMAAMSALFIVALEYTTVAFILFLQTLAPLTAAYFSWLLLRERVSRAVLIATVVSLVGVGIMVSATFTDEIEPLGTIAILIPISFGLYATLIRRAIEIDPQVPIFVGAAALVAVGIVGTLLTSDFSVSAHDAGIGMLAGSALLAIPVVFLNMATRVVPAPEVALLLMSEVILAPVWVWLFVDERPESTTLLGGLVILCAVGGLLYWRRAQAVVPR